MTIVFLNGTALFYVIRTLFNDALQSGFHYTVAGNDIYFGETAASVLILAGVGLLFVAAKPMLQRLHTVLERYRYGGGLLESDHGPGLGLTAAREIARLHGGTLLLESREGIGTAVRVSLSRVLKPQGTLHNATPDYDRSYDSILTGLAPCLPPEAFDTPD